MGDGDGGSAERSPVCKKRRRDANTVGDLRRVAEVVMVLSTMAEMRGGKEPTAAEKALVAEARERLMEVCEGLRPKDLFLSEAVRVVVEDLGLIPSKDLAKGFRPPKIAIAEKVLLTKRKMEEAKGVAIHSSVYSSQQFPMVLGAKTDSRGTMLHGDPMNLNKSSPILLSTGAVQNSSPVAHVPYAASTSVPSGQPRLSQTQAINSAINPSIPLPYREAAHLRSDARLHGHTIIKEARGTSADYVPQKGLTISSGPPVTGSLAMLGQTNNLLDQRTIKSEINTLNSSNQEMVNKEVEKLAIQPGPADLFIGHQVPQDLILNHSASSFTNHNDIAKNVQQVLQSKVSNHASWTPPSTEYMTTPLNCQLCKIVITDMESLLICDGCEKGTHLKCLQSYGNKGIPKVEWHCPKCLNLSNGKPLPPKYGRVTRTIGVSKAVPNTGGAHASAQRTENSGSKDNQLKSIANGNSAMAAMHATSTGDNHHGDLASSTGTMDATVQEGSFPAMEREDLICYKTISNDLKDGDGSGCTSIGTQKDSSHKHIQNSELSRLTIESSSQPMNVSESTHSQKICTIDAEKTHQSQPTSELQIDNNIKVPDNVEAPEDQPRENNSSTIQELKENISREEASGRGASSDKLLEDGDNHQEMENKAMDKSKNIFDSVTS
ncbi:uncharacterized protein [Typha latifolia]